MIKTLILAVDRDDDFGSKGHVRTPCIGISACAAAAVALGTADPEDSDTNALYAAMNIYRDLETDHEPESFEIALICGSRKVGHRSDIKLLDELGSVLDQVRPVRAILVDDGAEDESVYPIISSRIPIDSVRRVFVKQAPSVEGTLYVIGKYMKDPQKRERFLAPIAWIVCAVCAVYLISNAYQTGCWPEFVIVSTTPLIFMSIGLILAAYAYSIGDRVRLGARGLAESVRSGGVMAVFTIAALLLSVLGIVIGFYALDDIYTTRDIERVLVFAANAMWPVLFGIMVRRFGAIVEGYISHSSIRYMNIVGCLNATAAGLIMTGMIDYLIGYVGLYTTPLAVMLAEIFGGLLTAAAAGAVQGRMKRAADTAARDRGGADEVQ